jgi:hypothetical protein
MLPQSSQNHQSALSDIIGASSLWWSRVTFFYNVDINAIRKMGAASIS